MPSASQPGLHASDPVALTVESHARSMQADGYGQFSIYQDSDEIVAGFGKVEVRGENCDVALLRLANALLDDPSFSQPFLVRMRNPAKNPPTVRLRDNHLTARTVAGRQ